MAMFSLIPWIVAAVSYILGTPVEMVALIWLLVSPGFTFVFGILLNVDAEVRGFRRGMHAAIDKGEQT